MIKDVFLSEVIATRLSHDLIGNIGAVANAVELMNDGDEDDKEDIRNILNFSSDVLSKRLKFFRLCFGLSNASIKTLDEMTKVIKDYLSTLGNPQFPISFETNLDTPQVYKLVLPAVMIMADVMTKGGKIVIQQTEHGIHISAVSDFALNAAKLNNIDLILGGKDVEDNPSGFAPLYYLLRYLDGNDVLVSRRENTLILGE